MVDPLYAFVGLIVGALIGLTGVGGGSLMTPLLILLFGVQPVTAVGTDLLFAACTKIVGAAVHARSQTIDWTVTRLLASGSVPATAIAIGGLAALHPHTRAVSTVLTPFLGATLLLTALLVVFQQRVLGLLASRSRQLSLRRRTRLTIMAGAILGVLVSFSSIGAGALGVTALTLLHPALPTARVVGSDIMHAIPLTLMAGAGYWFIGAVDWPLLLSLLCGSIPGIIAGSLLAARVPTGVLRMVLASVLVVASAKLLT